MRACCDGIGGIATDAVAGGSAQLAAISNRMLVAIRNSGCRGWQGWSALESLHWAANGQRGPLARKAFSRISQLTCPGYSLSDGTGPLRPSLIEQRHSIT